jgi:hypothetical protein
VNVNRSPDALLKAASLGQLSPIFQSLRDHPNRKRVPKNILHTVTKGAFRHGLPDASGLNPMDQRALTFDLKTNVTLVTPALTVRGKNSLVEVLFIGSHRGTPASFISLTNGSEENEGLNTIRSEPRRKMPIGLPMKLRSRTFSDTLTSIANFL